MDKPKQFAVPAPKIIKNKRQSTMPSVGSLPTRGKVSTSAKTKSNVASRPKLNNTAVDLDTTLMRNDAANMVSDMDEERRQIAYGKFLRAMLEECVLNDKIEREETEMDIQMAQLADRFHKTLELLDRTNRRLKDIKFVAEQKR